MKGHPRLRWLAVAMRAGVLSTVIVLSACQPEQTPASAARTAAAERTPAAPPVAQSTGVPSTLAPGRSSATAQAPARQTPTPEPAPASLTASPNPIPLGAGSMGTTKISWSTGQPVDGQVYVSENGEPEKLFSSGSNGSQDAPWIQPDHRYEFRLYARTTHDQVLAAVTVGNSSTGTLVKAPNPSPRIDLRAEPNPVPADDQELGTSTITWSTDTGGDLYVSEDGGPEQLFASGISGTAQAYWICRGSTYEFRLYSGSQRTDPLKTLTVTRAEDEPDHEPPPVVECNGTPGP